MKKKNKHNRCRCHHPPPFITGNLEDWKRTWHANPRRIHGPVRIWTAKKKKSHDDFLSSIRLVEFVDLRRARVQNGALRKSMTPGRAPGFAEFDVPMGGRRGRDPGGISIGSTTHPYSYSASCRRRRRWPSPGGHLWQCCLRPAAPVSLCFGHEHESLAQSVGQLCDLHHAVHR